MLLRSEFLSELPPHHAQVLKKQVKVRGSERALYP